eukprot:3258425-Lingulodinium_polyedra.AAC.1
MVLARHELFSTCNGMAWRGNARIVVGIAWRGLELNGVECWRRHGTALRGDGKHGGLLSRHGGAFHGTA